MAGGSGTRSPTKRCCAPGTTRKSPRTPSASSREQPVVLVRKDGAARRGEIPGRSKAVGGWPVRLRLWQREGRWPILTVFGFIGRPDTHIFLKPTVTRAAAREYGFDFEYASPPSWKTYRSVIEFAETVRRDLKDLRPRDMIDLQSFIWVQGSDEYQERAES